MLKSEQKRLPGTRQRARKLGLEVTTASEISESEGWVTWGWFLRDANGKELREYSLNGLEMLLHTIEDGRSGELLVLSGSALEEWEAKKAEEERKEEEYELRRGLLKTFPERFAQWENLCGLACRAGNLQQALRDNKWSLQEAGRLEEKLKTFKTELAALGISFDQMYERLRKDWDGVKAEWIGLFLPKELPPPLPAGEEKAAVAPTVPASSPAPSR